MTNYSNSIHKKKLLSLPTRHMKCTMRYGGVVVGGNGRCPQVWIVIHSHVHCIKDRAPYHAWGLEGCVNDCPLRCCGISIVMKIFTLFTVLRIVSEKMLCDTVYTISHKEQKLHIGNLIPFKAGSFTLYLALLSLLLLSEWL